MIRYYFSAFVIANFANVGYRKLFNVFISGLDADC